MRHVFRSAWLLTIMAAATMTVAAAQQPTFNTNKQVTLVMKNGDRHSGTLVYHNDANFNLIENGQEKAYPVEQMALVDFGSGDPTAAEINQLPASRDPAELQRHMLVLSDGTALKGKLYTIKENALTFDTENGQRRDFELSNIKRMYVSAPGARELWASKTNESTGVAATTGSAGSISVEGSRGWTDTGITVRRGQRVSFNTTGQVAFRSGGDATGPDGNFNEDRTGTPVPAAGVGALIGRVGNGAPFPIGANKQGIAMPAAGRLFLGINDANTGDNSGNYSVVIATVGR
jgi:hypothetical protein